MQRADHVLTCDQEVAMLLQRLTIFAHYVVQAQIQLIEGQCLLGVSSCLSSWVIICFLETRDGLHHGHTNTKRSYCSQALPCCTWLIRTYSSKA